MKMTKGEAPVTPLTRYEYSQQSRQVFRLFCQKNIPLIRTRPIICPETSPYSTVFIEFRVLPHVEFIIRNTILKCKNFAHTVVCGNKNYEQLKGICDAISPNIRIIKMDIDDCDVNDYNNLMYERSFWKLFNFSKVLIYQEDTMIFKDNIGDFVQYNYIGAPWDTRVNGVFQGNGGFSLRDPILMIRILLEPTNFAITNYWNGELKKLQDGRILDKFPEDVFFSSHTKTNLPSFNTASSFSTENVVNIDSLGGHQFWNCDPNWLQRMIKLVKTL